MIRPAPRKLVTAPAIAQPMTNPSLGGLAAWHDAEDACDERHDAANQRPNRHAATHEHHEHTEEESVFAIEGGTSAGDRAVVIELEMIGNLGTILEQHGAQQTREDHDQYRADDANGGKDDDRDAQSLDRASVLIFHGKSS